MAASPVVTELQVEGYVFPPVVKAPGSDKTFFLGGAGARGLEIEGKFIKFTAHGLYLEESAISILAPKWKGKTGAELADSPEFFQDIITGPFEKLTYITMILPLTGPRFSEKVMENSVEVMKASGTYTDEEAKAVDKFLESFKNENFPPGRASLFTQSPLGSLTIAFCEHGSIPEVGNAVIENKNLSEAILDTIIGEHGVNPEGKRCLAAKVSELMKDEKLVADLAKVGVPNGKLNV